MTTTKKNAESTTTYYFIENKYPVGDPNIDLNFDNDILYSELVDDDIDKYTTPYVPEVAPYKPTEKMNIRKEKITTKSNYSVYFYFILTIIGLMLLWYFYKDSGNEKKNIVESRSNDAELTMLSPDMGMGSRYTRAL